MNEPVIPTKTILFDATFSWNGYNYQGKIGLYVLLTNILDKCKQADFEDYLNEHSIEYEWVEDFSIKKGDSYVSQHQVKHIDSQNISGYKQALETILSRKKGQLTRGDLKKYVNDNCIKNQILDDSACEDLIEELKTHQLLNSDCLITDDWESKLFKIEPIHQNAIKLCFSEIKYFLSVISKSAVYLHTSQKLKEPNITTINGLLKGQNNLSNNDIHYYSENNSTQNDYSLALSDSELDTLLIELTTKLTSFFHPGIAYQKNDIIVYVSSLKSLIDEHISVRHGNISKSTSNDSFSITKLVLGFNKVTEILQKDYRIQDKEYWNLICRDNFESTYLDYRSKLADRLKSNPKEEYISKLDNAKKLIDKHYKSKFRILIQELSLHICETQDKVNFYIHAYNKKEMQNLYLKFLIRITNQNIESPIRFNIGDNKLFHFSCIDFTEYDDLVNTTKVLIDEARVGLKKNSHRNAVFLHNVDFIISKIGSNSKPIDTRLDKITEGEKIFTHNDIDESHKYTKNKSIFFMDTEEALEKINE